MYKMPNKIYLSLFIFCAIFAQGIVGTFLEDDFRDSTNSLIRQKRVITRHSDQDVPLSASFAIHTVSIKIANVLHCVGTVVSMKTVITAARCVAMNVWAYKVFAGSPYSGRGAVYNVTEKRIHGNHPVQGQRFETGIALIYVDPPFQPQKGNIAPMDLHVTPLEPGKRGVVRGWGTCYLRGPSESKHSGRLRAIEVPIINHEDCVNSLRGFFEITSEYFCTHDTYQQCAYADAGTGFIIANSLAGIYIGSIDTGHDTHLKPDVFIKLQHPDYYQWILRNIVH